MGTKGWSILFAIVLLLESLLTVAAVAFQGLGWWMPKNIGTFGGIDLLFYLILGVTTFFFILTEVLLVWNMYRAAAEPGVKAPYVHGNHKLEILWSIIPGAILLLLAVAQIPVWAEIKYQSKKPAIKEALQVEVTARQWEWRLRYPSSKTIEAWDRGEQSAYMEKFSVPGFESKGQIDDVHLVNELHVYQGTKILVHLKTRDVLHSFFLPNVRLKQDAVPGRLIPVWFEVENKDGGNNYNTARKSDNGAWEDGYDPASNEWGKADQLWELACAEYCGTRHSLMRGKLYVHKDKADYLAWLKWVEAEQQRTTRE